MGLFFGEGNIFSKSGKNIFISGKDADVLTNSNGMTLDNKGNTMFSSESTASFTNTGKTITQSGNSFYCDGKTYLRSGNMLFGPGGKTWNGNMSDNDVKNIIFHDNT